MLGSGGGVGDSWKNLVTTSGAADSSDGADSTMSVEGNDGHWPGHSTGENKVTNVDATNAVFGDSNTTHVPSASLEAEEDFDMREFINWDNGDGCWDPASYH
jgi:hypothetical protein